MHDLAFFLYPKNHENKGPPPAIPYIFKFQNGCLHLCGPADSRMQRATNFDGPGLCIMEKIPEKIEKTAPMARQESKVSHMSLEKKLCFNVLICFVVLYQFLRVMRRHHEVDSVLAQGLWNLTPSSAATQPNKPRMFMIMFICLS